MEITYKNIIKYLKQRIPDLKNSPGYDETDDDTPYVAFASFLPFVKKNNLLDSFISELSDIYEYTDDRELKNLIFIELFENAEFSFEERILSLSKPKMVHDWKMFKEINDQVRQDGKWRPYNNFD